MPYKTKEESKEAVKRWREKHREGITGGITKAGITEGLQAKTGGGITGLPPAWQAVVDYLRRDSGNLGKLQAIVGSVGKYGEQVYFGGLSIQEIGEVIGSGPPVAHEVGQTVEGRDYCGRLRGPVEIRDATPLRADEHMHSVLSRMS